ncbi:glycosyltransferase [Nostoc sp.]|uniref:glycosyltransferase n=1 Tax=Nostoc sp. TaxID=1180 RepID=UPI002FF7D5D1
MYKHQPGKLSKGAVLDVGLKCAHSCKFCYYSYLDKTDDQFRGMRKAKFRSFEECKEILNLLKTNGFINFDVTGGEPTLHPHIIELMRYAHQELGLHGRIITLGQFLMKKMPNCQHEKLIDDLLKVGLENFLFSLHAVNEELFQQITGESFDKLQRAMYYLDNQGFQYTSNTVVFEWNYKHLPQVAHEILKHEIYLHNFIIMNAYYEWNNNGKAFGVQAKYSDIYPYLKEAVEILESNNRAVNIRYAPLCAFKGLEKNLVGMVGVRYDPYEWMNMAGHMGGTPDLCAHIIPIQEGEIENHLMYREIELIHENGVKVTGSRGSNLKHFSEVCTKCSAKDVCDGIDPNYLKLYGDQEFIPYIEKTGKAPLQNARFSYTAPFIVKTSQQEDMKRAVKEEFSKNKLNIINKEDQKLLPTISVVIPCYNSEKYITETITSVLNQTCQDFEIIVVNDGSTDNSQFVVEKLIKSYTNHQISLINQSNSGQPAIARNRGIAEARGKYILPLDADDVITPTMLEECLNLLETDQSSAIAYTDRQDFGATNELILAGNYDFSRLRHANHISYCALFRKDIWGKVGGYRTNVRGCEDWDFWIAAGAIGYFGRRIPKPLFKYRRNTTGVYQDVLQNFDIKVAQIILNNCEVYEPKEIIAATEFLYQGLANDSKAKMNIWQDETMPENKIYKELILSEIPENNYKNVLHIGCGHGFITKDLAGEKVLGVDILSNAINKAKADENNGLEFIQSCLLELVHKTQGNYDLIVITGVLYSQYIGKSHNFIYSLLDKLIIDNGILICCHIDEWYKARFPYLMLDYSLFQYRQHTQRLEVYVK